MKYENMKPEDKKFYELFEEYRANKPKNEAVRRMWLMGFEEECISNFENGLIEMSIIMSENPGASRFIRPIDDNVKELISKTPGLVYHVLEIRYPFSKIYAVLAVDPDPNEWEAEFGSAAGREYYHTFPDEDYADYIVGTCPENAFYHRCFYFYRSAQNKTARRIKVFFLVPNGRGSVREFRKNIRFKKAIGS